MRAGLSTIQQTLTPEAATVLNHSIAEAGRRNHGQTTPLHVAATLLASPSGFLRQACIKSHPNSSHPLQCRALELCFSVALERLPTAQNMSSGMEPPISNALMAALKRAQAHQRRGCPEQQQQPLLAVKVELEQLIISILDDPSVSRVMREASFSSPAVKATIEQSLNTSASVGNSSPMGLGFRAGATTVPPAANRNLYLNPRLQRQGTAAQLGQQRGEEVKRVIDILLRTKKRNPVLVGESEPEAVVRELLRRLENKELGEGPLGNAQVIRLEKEFSSDRAQIPAKVKELGDLIANSSGGGVVLDLGDLKWLVEQPMGFGVAGSGAAAQQHVSEVGRAAVAEMGKLLNRFGEGTLGRLWLIGTATCETYLRCQVYHPTMENDWDLQAVPIAARAPSGAFPRLGANGILSSSVESLSPMKGFPAATTAPPRRLTENLDPGRRTSCCPQCSQNYEQELATPLPKESDNSSSELKSEAARPALPQWLQNAKAPDTDDKATDQTKGKEEEVVGKQRSQELQKKWSETCFRLHPSFHQPNVNAERITPVPFMMTGLYNTNPIGRQSFPSKLQLNRNLGETQQSNTNQVPAQPSEKVVSSPGSPVRTDLVLGRTKTSEDSPDQTHKERVKDLLGSLSSEPQNNLHETQSNKLTHGTLDADSFKKLLKGLTEKVWWQREAASAVAATVTHCRVGNGKQRGAVSKGDMWLLFMGRDRAGKKKMASALSELVSGSGPVIICFGSHCDDGASGMSFRGKTALDRIAEAVRRNPFSVIMLEDIDEADILVRGSIKRAMVRGRLTDSHGREVSLGSIIFILTSNWLPDNLKYSSNGVSLDGEKLAGLTKGDCQLKISLCERRAKRPANWLHDKERPTKPSRKETSSGLAFDLNEAADVEDDRGDGSHNSSDLTIEHEYEQGLNNNPRSSAISAVPHELLDAVDEAILFKHVSLGPIQSNISSAITKKFCTIVGDGVSIEVQEEALEKIAGGVWLGEVGLEEWLEKVLSPSFHQLKARLAGSIRPDCMAVRLEDDGSSDSRGLGDWLPSSVKVVLGDGL